MWEWVAGLCCGVPIVLLILLGIVGNIAHTRERAKALRDGERTIAILVQANTELFRPGPSSYPAQFLILLDPAVADPRPILEPLAKRVSELKTDDPRTPAEEEVAALVRDESYMPARRVRLPTAFSGRTDVYSVHIWVDRSLLPSRMLTERHVHAVYTPGEEGYVFMLPYPDRQRFAAQRRNFG